MVRGVRGRRERREKKEGRRKVEGMVCAGLEGLGVGRVEEVVRKWFS